MIFLDFDDFESFPRPGYGYRTPEIADMSLEMTRFPCFPGYVLAESPIWADSWIWHDLMALKTRNTGFWWFWTPDTGFWWFRKLSGCLFRDDFLGFPCFWDDFPAFRMLLGWFCLLIASICLVYPLILAVSWIPDDFRTDLLDFECFPVSRAFYMLFGRIF